MSDRPADCEIAAPSGKSAATENFPVGSWLIRADLRAATHRFYRFARMADDIADAPHLAPEEKIRRLDLMERDLADDDSGAPFCCELLIAFRRDATKTRYADWDELMDYCRYSAAPVGRFLLDLHGEERATWPAGDALCAALQVINHLQDCGEDFRVLDRIYLPLDLMAEAGARIADLGAAVANPALRQVLDRCLDRCADLLAIARDLPGGIRDFRLRAEAATILVIAEKLVAKLRRRDPLAGRVRLRKSEALIALGRGLILALRARGRR